MYNTLGGYNSIVAGAAFQLSPEVSNSLSLALDPSITYVVAGVFNLNPETVSSLSLARTPMISFGQSQVIGTVTTSFAPDLYTAQFKG